MSNKTLRSQFRLWTVLLVLVPSLLIMVIYTVSQIKVAKQQNLEMISQRVHAQERLIDYWIAERIGSIRELSKTEAFITLDEQRIKHVLNLKQQYDKSFDSLSYIDKDGIFRLSTFSSEIRYPSAIGQPYFEAAVVGKEHISDVVIGRNSGLPIINFSVPLFDGAGKFKGLILGSIKTATLEALLRENWFGETGEVILVNSEGTFLTDPRFVNVLMDMGLIQETAIMKLKLPDDALRNIRFGESGTATWMSYRGQKLLAAYVDVPERGWTLIGRISEAEVIGPIYRQLAMIAGGNLCLVFLMMPLATLITNRIKRPLDWLIKQSEFITTEQYEMVGHDRHTENISFELGILCETFVRMGHKIVNTISLLQENEAKLEYKVHERTIALSDMNVVLEEEISQNQAANKSLKDSRDALVISETRYKDLFDNMHNGCVCYKVLFDEAGNPVDLKYIDVNHAYENFAGKLASEIIGNRRIKMFSNIDEDIIEWVNWLITVAISGEAVRFKQCFKHQQRMYSASAYSPSKGYVAVISEDVTQYVNLQKEVARMDRLNLIGNMAAGLAHEIRNPMTVVKGYLQYFKKKLPNGLHDQLDVVLSEIARIEVIITDFLAIAKTKPTEPEEQHLNGIIDNIAPLLLSEALKRGMSIEFKNSKDIPKIILAEKEIKQLLLNLVTNGLNAMEQYGALTIETKYQDNAVLLIVDDSGCGISKDLQAKIFDPFFTTRDEGTGLGLSVCASIVASHNGTIEVHSEEGKGTRFIITFPV